jgi:hypothetical protein
MLEPGLKLLKIFKEYSSKTCILDDFGFYEGRQKTILEKKAKQQFPKQARLFQPFQLTHVFLCDIIIVLNYLQFLNIYVTFYCRYGKGSLLMRR